MLGDERHEGTLSTQAEAWGSTVTNAVEYDTKAWAAMPDVRALTELPFASRE